MCEIDPWRRQLLAQRFEVPIYGDVCSLTAERLERDEIGKIDAIVGGFPCQDTSIAGKGAGIDGERSGLAFQFVRLVFELRPKIVVMENAAALLARGLGRLLGELSAIGYDAEWEVIRASDVGAEHFRARTWVVAYPQEIGPIWRGCLREAKKSMEYEGLGKGELWERRSQPRPVGVHHGIPDWSHRIGSLGDAVVPQIPEAIGTALFNRLWLQEKGRR